MSLLSSLKKIATISSISFCLSITATWISKSSVEAQVVNANYFTHLSSINLVSNQSDKNTIWLTSNNNNLLAERFSSNSTSKTQKSHILLLSLLVLGSGVIAWEVRFRFLRVTLIQALEKIYCRLPHYQNQLRIKQLEAQLSLLENNFQSQLQQQIEERVNNLLVNHSEIVQQQIEERETRWRSQHTGELQQLQNQIGQLENELGNLQIEERVNSLFANHSEEIQQRLEACQNRWRSQHTGELQQLQNKIEHIENKPVVLQSEWQNTQNFLEKLILNWAIESINEDRKILFNAFDDLEKAFINIETKVDSLKKEVDNCENNITGFYNEYQKNKTIYEAENITTPKLNTVLDVLLEAERQYPILEIFKSAKSSARKANNHNDKQVKQIYSAFKAIAQIGEKHFKYKQEFTSLGNRLEAEFKKKGFANNYRPTEHEETRNQYGDKRIFCHSDRCVQIFRHLTFNNHGCSLQIYFEFDREQEKVIIGYCGNHLPITSRPT